LDERRQLDEDDEPIRLDHENVLDRLEAFHTKTATAAEELIDLTLIEATADLVVLPEADDPADA
jgi:hypothetical protein